MKILILNTVVCCPSSAYHGKTCDILVNDKLIEDIQSSFKKAFSASKGMKVFDAKGAFVSTGWLDMRSNLCDPGFEYKEDLESAAKAAAAGGFTAVAALPSTLPVIQSKSEVEYVINKSTNLPVSIIPYGCISQNRDGKEMAELFDMFKAGAPAFTDANKPIAQASLMLRALQYAKIFNGLIISHAEDTSLSAGTFMHEGFTSTNLGLKGNPNMSEELMVTRDIELAKYAESRIHFAHISSKGSVEIIRKAKKQGVQVTCDVSVAHLCFTDEHLKDYDSNYKINPPIRGKEDRKALWEGLVDGTIDCIVSDHHPEDKEHKVVEFEYANKGMINLQTCYSLINQYKPKTFSNERLQEVLSSKPRQVLGLSTLKIEKGAEANLTIFNEEITWLYDEKSNLSRSQNSPLMGTTLKGKAIATVCKGNIHIQ
jgi:dihydroorotase